MPSQAEAATEKSAKPAKSRIPPVPISVVIPRALERKVNPNPSDGKHSTNGVSSFSPPPSNTTRADTQQAEEIPTGGDGGPLIVNGSTHRSLSSDKESESPVVADAGAGILTEPAVNHNHRDSGSTSFSRGSHKKHRRQPRKGSKHSSGSSYQTNMNYRGPSPQRFFYGPPAAVQTTTYPSVPSSAASTTFPPNPVYFNHASMHRLHPSNHSVVFGGFQECSHSAPTPDVNISASAYPPYHTAGPEHFQYLQPSYPNIHANKDFDSHAPFVYPQQIQTLDRSTGYPPPSNHLYNGVSNYHRRLPSSPPQGVETPLLSRFGTPEHNQCAKPTAREPVDSFGDFAKLNGIVPRATPPLYQDLSHGINYWAPGEIQDENPVPEGNPVKEQSESSNGIVAPATQTEQPSAEQSGLTEYIGAMFGDIELADYVIEFPDKGSKFFVHGILASRSPTLKQHMCWLQETSMVADRDQRQRKIIRLDTSGLLLRYDAFDLALRYLYGHRLLQLDHPALTSFHQGTLNGCSSEKQMGFTLAYAAAGHLLQLDKVAGTGIKLAAGFLDWETIERALAFALDGVRDIAAISMASMNASSLCESGEDLDATGENGGKSTCPTTPVSLAMPQPLAAVYGSFATYAPYSQQLLGDIIKYITTNFPITFQFDDDVSQLESFPRLPAVAETRSPVSNPRLSKIQFGDYTARAVERPGLEIVLSKILISLPLPLLRRILESRQLGPADQPIDRETRLRIAERVITEREKRRRRALQSKHVSDAGREANKEAWIPVGWEEDVKIIESDSVVGFQLTRVWKGFLNPNPPQNGRI